MVGRRRSQNNGDPQATRALRCSRADAGYQYPHEAEGGILEQDYLGVDRQYDHPPTKEMRRTFAGGRGKCGSDSRSPATIIQASRSEQPLPLKKELRQVLREKIADISPEKMVDRTHRACQLLFDQAEFKKSETVMVFLSMAGEIDTSPIVLRCWQDRKRVLAPKVSWNQRRMLPVEIRSMTDDLMVTGMGIREPISGIPFPISMLDMVIVPGLGFDEAGNRLGRGRGFYDRFLAHPEFQGIACGLALEQQMVKDIPVGPLDRNVDMLVTDKKVRRFKH